MRYMRWHLLPQHRWCKIQLPRTILLLSESDFVQDGLHALSVLGTSIILEDNIHLLKRLVASLGNEEQDPQEHEQTKGTEEDVGSKFKSCKHVWCDLPNNEVHHVVAADNDAHGLTTVAGREDFRREQPADRAPGIGEIGSKDLKQCQ